MAIFEYTRDSLIQLKETTMREEKIYERIDLQRLLKRDVKVLSSELMLIAEEYGEFEGSNRRIDLLCIDESANLIVVELKRTEDGGHMELQAIRYAAMISRMTFQHLVDAHSIYLKKEGHDENQAEKLILEHLGWAERQPEEFGKEVKIILGSSDFSRELTTSVLWLNDMGINITCMRFKPYRTEDGRILLDIQQLIPLPEAMEFQTKIREKSLETRQSNIERHTLRFKFWSELLAYAKTKTTLHANRKPGQYSWVGGKSGRSGLSFNYSTREFDSQVELWIDVGDENKNMNIYNQIFANHAAITAALPHVEWQDLPESRGCRLRIVNEGGWKTDSNNWRAAHEIMVSNMIELEKVLRPYVDKLIF